MTAAALRNELEGCRNPQKALILQGFFKTGPGQYGEGDLFWGLPVPLTRSIAVRYRTLPLEEVEILLMDPVHEVRLSAAILLVEKFRKGSTSERGRLFEFYSRHTTCFNNWDLVDLSCCQVVGGWLSDKDKAPLYAWAESENLWEQRIAIVSTLTFIRRNEFDDTLALAKRLLHHPHDLIQKAVGWMLREVGKRNMLVECEFLLENDRYKTMPRTMLRYAIERFPEPTRQAYLKGLA